MSIQVTGVICYIEMGTGTWALEADTGVSYELYEAPTQLLQAGLKAKVEGQIREDIMTVAMIGPVLEVQSFEVL